MGGVLRSISDALEGVTNLGRRSATTLAEGFGQVGTAAMGLGTAMIASGVAIGAGMTMAAKAAADFSSQMILLHTHAGLSENDMKSLQNWILQTASSLGFDPTSLAQAAYRAQSVMSSLPKEMQKVETVESMLSASAQLAAIGHANLEDSVKAVSRAYVVYSKDGYTASQITGIFNATVGEGDMRLQELNVAFASGLLPVAEQAGIKLESVGAALATMSDEGIPAARAAIYLRSAIIQMTIPSDAATAALQAIGVSANDTKSQIDSFNQIILKAGINQTDVAKELKKTGSLGDTIAWLGDKLKTAGLSGQDAGTLIEKAFGGIRSGTGIVTLYNNLGGLIQKEKDAAKNATEFNTTWEYFQKHDPDFMFKQLASSLQSLVIILGFGFLPSLMKFTQLATPIVKTISQWVAAHSDLVAQVMMGASAFLIIGGAITFVSGIFLRLIGLLIPVITFFWELGGSLYAALGVMMETGASAGTLGGVLASAFGGPVTIAIAVLAALIAIGVLLITHWKQVKAIAMQVWGEIAPYVMEAVGLIMQVVNFAMGVVSSTWKAHHGEIMADAQRAWALIKIILIGALIAIGISIAVTATILAVIIVVIALLVAGFVFLAGKIMDFGGVLGRFVSQAASTLGRFFSWLGTTAHNAVNAVTTTFNNLVSSISNFFGRIISGAENAWAQFSSKPAYWLGYMVGMILIFLFRIQNAINDAFIALVVLAFQSWNSFWNAVDTWLAKAIVSVVNFGISVILSIGNFFTWLVKTAQQKWSDFATTTYNALVHLPGTVAGIMQQIPGIVWNFLVSAASAAWNGTITIALTILKALADLPGKMWDIGKSIVTGLWNGIKGAGGWLWNQITSFASGIIDAFKKNFKITSPSLLAAEEVGIPISQGIGLGMKMNMPSLHSLATGLTGGIMGPMGARARSGSSAININQNQNQKIELRIDNEVLGQIIVKSINNWREINEFP